MIKRDLHFVKLTVFYAHTGGGVPVLLGHCLVGSSALFSWGPPESSLAYVLADSGEFANSIRLERVNLSVQYLS